MFRRYLAIALLSGSLFGCRTETARLDDVQRMAYGVKPAVVRVTSLSTAELRFTDKQVAGMFATLERGGLTVQRSMFDRVETGAGGSGTGFIVHPDGYVLTSAHVVEPTRDRAALEKQLRHNGAIAALLRVIPVDTVRAIYAREEIQQLVRDLEENGRLENVNVVSRVELSNGEGHSYTIREASPPFSRGGSDIALLKIARPNLPILRLANSESVHLQESIWAVGYPAVASSTDEVIGGWLSSDSDLEATFNPGTITAVKKTVSGIPLFQSNVAIYAGNSGGPAVNRQGAVVAISSWGHSSAEQIRFLLPVNAANEVLGRAKIRPNQEGAFNKAYLVALESASNGDWITARRQLTVATRLFPNSPDLIRFARDAEDQVRSLPFWRLHPYISAGVLGGILLLIVISAILLRRQRRPLRAPVTVMNEYFVQPDGRGDGEISETLITSAPLEGTNATLGKLTVLNGAHAGDRFGLCGSGIRIGREEGLCEIVLENPKVSRLHAEVVSIDGRVLLIDRNSSNGTYVNDRKIDRHFLKDGDIIYFGGRNAVAVAFHN